RGEDATARPRHPMQLAHGAVGILDVLEHLEAEDDVVRPVLHRERLDRALEVRMGIAADVDADVCVRAGEVRVVRLHAAADVEHAQPGHSPPLRLEPVRERRTHRPARKPLRRVPPVLSRPGTHSIPPAVAARPNPSHVTAWSGIPATIPSPIHVPAATRIHPAATSPRSSCRRVARSASQRPTTNVATPRTKPTTPVSARSCTQKLWTPHSCAGDGNEAGSWPGNFRFASARYGW